jgi:hypothetical protein
LKESILWRRLDRPGHEFARLSREDSGWLLSGAAVFLHDQLPCRLDYAIRCDLEWSTRSGSVEGWVGDQAVQIEVSADPSRRWFLNGQHCPEVGGCVDLDLNFSPSTNLLPIRRLGLAAGQEAPVRTAWLRFPSFALELLEQRYLRIDAHRYRYESAGGRFVADLQVNDAGFVIKYGDIWHAESEIRL